MRKFTALIAVFFALILVSYAFAASTTTLGAVVANNTSTSSQFAGTSGNQPASNVSKVDIRSLLYPGATTKIYAHFMPWFADGHMDVGYRSDDAAQVHRQIDDMISRGIQGIMIDWYGPNAAVENNTTNAVMQDAESRGGRFVFAVVEDGGALDACHSTPGCDLTQQTIKDLTYAYATFQKSPAYMRIEGRPVVAFFDPDRFATLNWDQIRAAVPGNPLFIFQDADGFGHAQSEGAMSWVGISGDRNDWGQGYHDYFYAAARQNPAQHTFGSAKKGFDDTAAPWSQNRVVNQNCGTTWLNTFASIAKYYNAAHQLESLQIVTWNDYEEGSAIETGIENCVAVKAEIQGTALRWSMIGDRRTVDHFTVYMSSDGQNLELVGDFPVTANSMDVGGLGGSHVFFVQAVGKPSMTNHTSNGVSYPPAGPSFAVGVGPDGGKLGARQSGAYQVAVVPVNGFQGDVSLSCEAPASVKCSPVQGTVSLRGDVAKTSLIVSAGTPSASTRHRGATPVFAFLPSLGFAGLVLTGESKKRKLASVLGLCGVLLLIGLAVACGGGGMGSNPGNPAVSSASDGSGLKSPQVLTITASSGTVQQTATLTVQ